MRVRVRVHALCVCAHALLRLSNPEAPAAGVLLFAMRWRWERYVGETLCDAELLIFVLLLKVGLEPCAPCHCARQVYLQYNLFLFFAVTVGTTHSLSLQSASG